jgi:hypothetical protein
MSAATLCTPLTASDLSFLCCSRLSQGRELIVLPHFWRRRPGGDRRSRVFSRGPYNCLFATQSQPKVTGVPKLPFASCGVKVNTN